MPPLSGKEYLVQWLYEVGPCCSNGMAVTPISWQEITAWASSTGVRVGAWDSLVLKRLSAEYACAVGRFDNKNEPAPFAPASLTAEENDKIGNAFKLLAKMYASDGTGRPPKGKAKKKPA